MILLLNNSAGLISHHNFLPVSCCQMWVIIPFQIYIQIQLVLVVNEGSKEYFLKANMFLSYYDYIAHFYGDWKKMLNSVDQEEQLLICKHILSYLPGTDNVTFKNINPSNIELLNFCYTSAETLTKIIFLINTAPIHQVFVLSFADKTLIVASRYLSEGFTN